MIEKENLKESLKKYINATCCNPESYAQKHENHISILESLRNIQNAYDKPLSETIISKQNVSSKIEEKILGLEADAKGWRNRD